MSEGRRAAVKLLDGDSLPVVIHPRSTVDEILQLVSSHLSLKQPDVELFGIVFIDESRQIQLHHRVQFFTDSIYQLEHANSIELLFLEAMQQMTKGTLDLTDVDLYRIGAFVLQVYTGDYLDNDRSIGALRALLPTPTRLLSAYAISAVQYERIVTERHEDLRGMSRGTAIINFMSVVERSSTYGSRHYRVTDKAGNAFSLALNSRGIYQFDSDDYSRPKKIFYWKLLDNLYYRDRRFSIEIRDGRRVVQSPGDLTRLLDGSSFVDEQLARAVNDPTTQVSVSRRGLAAASVQVYSFFADSPVVCKSLWSAAIAQHQFFIEQQSAHGKQKARTAAQAGVNLVELSEKLTRLVSRSSIGSSLPSLSSLHSTSSCGTMPSAKVADGSSSCTSLPSLKNGAPQCSKTEEEKQRDRETFKELRERKDDLEERLRQKLAELRDLCIKEGMPKEMRRALLPGEELPKLKKRIGTSFQLSEEILSSTKADRISQIEADIELHRKIVAAAERLAKDKSMNKSVRKKRTRDLQAAASKLKHLELGLSQLKISSSKPDVSTVGVNGTHAPAGKKWSNGILSASSTRSCPTTPRGSIPDLTGEGGEKSDYEEDYDAPRPQSSYSNNHRFSQTSSMSSASSGPGGLPPSGPSGGLLQNPLRPRPTDELDNPLAPTSSKSSIAHQSSNGALPIYENIGYRSSAPYMSSYRQAHYPTLHDQQFARVQRAQSEHALAQTETVHGETNGTPTMNGLENGGPKASVETWHAPSSSVFHSPSRRVVGSRMTTSQSCNAGFSTASLDRRALKARISPQTVSASAMPDASLSSAPFVSASRPSPQRMQTTFPVSSSASSSSISPLRATGFESHRHSDELSRSPLTNGMSTRVAGSYQTSPATSSYSGSPQSLGYGSGSSIGIRTSASNLPNANPRMEALLDYYKEKSKPNQKTATIV